MALGGRARGHGDGDLDPVAAPGLGRVQGAVGLAQQLLGLDGVLGSVAMPKLAVIVPTREMSARSIARRSFSASSSAPSRSVSGSSSRNSSPPKRAAKSLARMLAASSDPIAASTLSPRSWPCRSLICLKWSRSSSTADSGVTRPAGVGDHPLDRLVGGAAVGQPGERVAGGAALGHGEVALVGQDRRGLDDGLAHAVAPRLRRSALAGDQHRADHLAADQQRLAQDRAGDLAARLALHQRALAGLRAVGAAEAHGQARARAQLLGLSCRRSGRRVRRR